MAKIIKLTKKQEQEAQSVIDNFTPEQMEEMKAFEEEFELMPESMQGMLLDLAIQLSEMSEKERNQFLEEMDKLAELKDGDVEDDFEDDLEFGDDYPHFLSRKDVQKFTLRVTLRGIKPSIYRKFNVPSNISLRHLSELIIDLMGWTNEHLNQFRKGDDYYAPAYQRKGEGDSMMGWGTARNHNQENYTIYDILSEKGKTIEWEYDFGDSWYHDIRLSSIGDYKENEPLITFIKGERACPPEDCGGIWGYEELLDIYNKKKSRKRLTSDEKERLEWYDMDPRYFDPEEFDTEYAQDVCDDFCE